MTLFAGGELEFFFFDENTGFINENDFVNISFWINTSECEEPNEEYYILESQTKTNKGRLEYDGRIVLWNKSCTVILEESIRCTTETGPAELYRKVNRSHTEIEFLWSWKEYKTKQLRSEKKPLKLNVSCKYFNMIFVRLCVLGLLFSFLDNITPAQVNI